MFRKLKGLVWIQIRRIILKAFPELRILQNEGRRIIADVEHQTLLGKNNKICSPHHLFDVKIGDYTYVAQNSYIGRTTIGKCCSIGPNLICGWGIHPLNTISTHPMFYSTKKQNGMTLSSSDKIEELKHIEIGNDVFIGANVTILDGVVIGDGAVIGAGAVVSKDIPPYAIAVGCLQDVEKMIFDVGGFVEKYGKCDSQ